MPPARTIYGDRGPARELGNQLPHERPMTTRLTWAKAPAPDRIDAAMAKISGLTARQRGEVRQAFVQLMKGGR